MKHKILIGILIGGIIAITFSTQAAMDLWKYTGGYLMPVVSTWKVGTSTTVYYGDGTNLTGIVGASTTTINGVSGPTFTFATSSDTNIGLNISTSTGQLTFTPTWIGTLSLNRVASSTLLTTTTAASTYVPYTGATASVILGSFGLSTYDLYLGAAADMGIYRYANGKIEINDVDHGQAAVLDLTAMGATTRTFTFPDVTGTFITSGNLTAITTVGTIATGTWQGTKIAYNYGGTGTSTALAIGYLWMGLDGAGNLVQVASSTLAVGSGVSSLNSITGATILAGTANQITVASSSQTITLSIPTSVIFTNASTTALSITGLKSGFLKIDANGNVSTSTIDISSDTNLAAGRSLTMSGDSVEADNELFNKIITFSIRNATTTQNPVAQHKFATAFTITRISCSTNNSTSSIQFDERVESTPFTAGTDVLNAALVCTTSTASSTSFANAGIAADAPLSLDIDAMNGNTTTTIFIHVEGTYDD